ETNEYVCSNPGQENIRNDIKKYNLNRIIIASCSPRMHLDTFRDAIKSAGLNPYLLEIANIREQCSWVHDDKEEATQKAIDLISGAIKRGQYLESLEPKIMPVSKEVLVIGGGIAGIMTTIELADKGFKVYLVEREPSLGGHMAQLSKTFPTLDCSQCILTPKMGYVSHHPNVEIITLAEPIAVEGTPGNYKVLVRKRPRYVNELKCTSCGECAQICPMKKPSKFEENLIQEKAISLPFQQAIPNAYAIDENYCIYLNRGKCRVCEKVCKGKAIDFNQKEEIIELHVGAIVACTGYQQLDMHPLGQYSYGLHPDIVTNLQFERLMLQGMHRPSNGKVPKKIAFILCSGSRSTATGCVGHCCKIGCMNAIKHSILLKKAVPDAEAWIFYTDIRAHGKGYEEFYAKARNHNVKFIRGRVAEVIPNGDHLLLRAEDTLLNMPIEETFDLVVLSPAIIPSAGTEKLAQILGVDLGPNGFFLERHHKLRPVDSKREGIFLAGCALGPKDIRETTMEGMATASKITTFLGKGEIALPPEVAYVDFEKCDACGVCLEYCPAEAIQMISNKAVIDPISCLGCGLCIPKCPQEAIDLKHSTNEQLLAQITGICEEDSESPKIVAFMENTTAYGAADLAGQNRYPYAPNIRIIGVPSTGRISSTHLAYAFATGADGVIIIEGHDSPLSEEKLREHIRLLKKELRKLGIKSLRLISTTTTLPQYEKVVNLFETFTKRISKLGRITDEKRSKIMEKIKGGKTKWQLEAFEQLSPKLETTPL
ncbi:MAG: FAD-dependent oxidoreductase, partial [Promethearchaeota archaeon]